MVNLAAYLLNLILIKVKSKIQLTLFTVLLSLGFYLSAACSRIDKARKTPQPKASQAQDEATIKAQAAKNALIARDFPLFGSVTGLQPTVRQQPTAESLPIGWLRIGAEVRLAPEPVKSPTCNTGWHRIYPSGWACAGNALR
jgi:hypothetical protein